MVTVEAMMMMIVIDDVDVALEAEEGWLCIHHLVEIVV